MRLSSFLALLSLLAIPCRGAADVSGYFKTFAVAREAIDVIVARVDTSYQLQPSGRFMFDTVQDQNAWQIHYELGADLNSEDLSTLPAAPSAAVRNDYRLTDIDQTIGSGAQKNQLVQNLDRINYQLRLDAGDLTIGRQAITFGAARFINPTDVFLPFDVRTLNTEYRVGIDAIRFQRPIGQLSEIDVGMILGKGASVEQSAAFVQLKTNIAGHDLQFSTISFSEQLLVGAGLQTALGEFGAWFEVASVSGDEHYERVSLGLDYAFNDRWFGQLEWHYNGAGEADPAAYLQPRNPLAYQVGGVFLLGQHYLIPSLSWQASALLNLSLAVIGNLDDHSSFTQLAMDFSLSDNWYLGGGIYLFNGRRIEVGNSGPVPGSEYGDNPDSLYLNLRYYF